MTKKYKVLSLFDGISCARVALERAGIPVEVYYASEIDRYSIQISRNNWPDIKQLGTVVGLKVIEPIDLLIGGSPCQDLSIANKGRKGLSGERSGLFWEYVRILKEIKPKYFILENVASMSYDSLNVISDALGVTPIMIDASLVSAQRRKRLFWTNIPGVKLPLDRNISIKDILRISSTLQNKPFIEEDIIVRATVQAHAEMYRDKCPTLSASMGMGGGYEPLLMSRERGEEFKGKYINGEQRKIGMRKLTVNECELLQSLPVGYTNGVSKIHQYKSLGNAFNVDVVAHVLSFI